MLRYYDDLSEPEVAAALGVTVGTVKSTVARAVAKLREDAELGADGSSWDLPATEGLLPACSRGTITVRDLTRRVGPWTAR
jgi:Sigma-70, region 4